MASVRNVIKNYFQMIDLDPVYRMADEGEIRLMKSDVIQNGEGGAGLRKKILRLHSLWRATRRENRMTDSTRSC